MGFLDYKCVTCGKRVPKGSLSEGMCPACRDMISFYNGLNEQLKAATGKHFEDSVEAIVKADKSALQKVFFDAMADYTSACKACGETFAFSDLKEGYCSVCHSTLLDYLDVRDSFQKLFGVTLRLEPSAIVKMTEEEWREELSKQLQIPEKKETIHGFSEHDSNITLEALRDDYGVKRAKFITYYGPDCKCAECRKRNGRILPIDEAIAFIQNNTEHKDCGKWVRVRERHELIT